MIVKEETTNRVCILWPSLGTYSTFVRAHLKHLPAKTQILHGGNFPRFVGNNSAPLAKLTIFDRLYRKIAVSLFQVPTAGFLEKDLTRFLIKNQIDAVLAEMPQIAAAVLPSVRAAQKPLFVYFLGGSDVNVNPHLSGIHYAELFQYAAGIFAVSKNLERQLLELKAPRDKLFYNPCGVDLSLFQGGDPAKAPPVFMSVGRFVDVKGPHLTILAFQQVVEAIPDARLLMVGEGRLWEACKLLVRSLKLTKSVEFLGYQPHERVAELMSQVRAVVQHSIRTSYGGAEGTPCAILEAGASGLPVVATRHTGIADAVIHGTTGFLIEEGDIPAMARYMIQLGKEPGLAQGLGLAAREKIQTDFSMEKTIDCLWGQIRAHIDS